MITPQDQFAALQKANLDTTISLASAVLAGAERLATLQLSTAKELLAENARTARALVSVKNPQDLAGFQSSVEPIIERALPTPGASTRSLPRPRVRSPRFWKGA